MARSKRFKVKGEIVHYHIISRTVGQQFLLGEKEKETLVQIIRYFSRMYFIKVNAYCVMSNHFHLVIQSLPGQLFSDEEVYRRIKEFIRKDKKKKNQSPGEEITVQELCKAREKLGDISEFCRSVKQTFSVWYNKENDRSGYLWGDRFKSLILGNTESIQRCCAYIELNPVRAGMAVKPEDYRWCSLHNRQFAPKKDRFCCFDGVFPEAPKNHYEAYLLKEYRSIVYYLGNIKRTTLKDLDEGRSDDARSSISDDLYNEAVRRRFKLQPGEMLLGRVRYFTDGAIIGSKDFIIKAYKRFAGTAILKKERVLYPTGISANLFSIKRLRPKTS